MAIVCICGNIEYSDKVQSIIKKFAMKEMSSVSNIVEFTEEELEDHGNKFYNSNIEMANVIYVIGRDIDDNVNKQIEYARDLNKPIVYDNIQFII